MKKLKFTFKNAAGEELAGLLELPENPKAFALLAHCLALLQIVGGDKLIIPFC